MIPNLAKPKVEWDIRKKLFVVDALSPELCNSLIEKQTESLKRGINKYSGVFDISFHACLLDLDHEIHAALQNTWKQVIDYFKFDIDFVEPYELKRYTVGDFFGKHIDNYYGLTTNLDRKLTMSIQINPPEDYACGELLVANNVFKGKQGSAVVFPSFFPHEVKPVTEGTRWSLIGWAWCPYWR